jgi:hypothetical protein
MGITLTNEGAGWRRGVGSRNVDCAGRIPFPPNEGGAGGGGAEALAIGTETGRTRSFFPPSERGSADGRQFSRRLTNGIARVPSLLARALYRYYTTSRALRTANGADDVTLVPGRRAITVFCEIFFRCALAMTRSSGPIAPAAV